MVSVKSASCYIMSASCYQSRSLMYIHGLIPQNFTEVAEAVLIDGHVSLYILVGKKVDVREMHSAGLVYMY